MSRGRLTPVDRTTDGLIDVEGINPTTYHGASMDASDAAEVNIRDGSVSGRVLATLRTAAAGKDDTPITERGIGTSGGIWVEIVTGTTPNVTVYVS